MTFIKYIFTKWYTLHWHYFQKMRILISNFKYIIKFIIYETIIMCSDIPHIFYRSPAGPSLVIILRAMSLLLLLLCKKYYYYYYVSLGEWLKQMGCWHQVTVPRCPTSVFLQSQLTSHPIYWNYYMCTWDVHLKRHTIIIAIITSP